MPEPHNGEDTEDMKDYSAEINAAVKTLGDIAFNAAKSNCPVRTGRLKRSIALRVQHDRAKNSDEAVIGTTVPYAQNVEFGGYNRRPKPFLESGAAAAQKSAALIFTMFFRGK